MENQILSFIAEHWLIVLAMIIILLLIISYDRIFNPGVAKMNISPQDLTTLINRENPVIIDLRPIDAFRQGHIINAINLPNSQLEQNGKQLSQYQDKLIVMVESKGQISPKSIKTAQQYCAKLKILSGGMRAWKEAGLPTQRG